MPRNVEISCQMTNIFAHTVQLLKDWRVACWNAARGGYISSPLVLLYIFDRDTIFEAIEMGGKQSAHTMSDKKRTFTRAKRLIETEKRRTRNRGKREKNTLDRARTTSYCLSFCLPTQKQKLKKNQQRFRNIQIHNTSSSSHCLFFFFD